MVEKHHLIISVDSIVAVLFAMGLYIKEFYILPSGSLQIGDILLLFAFVICLLGKKINLQHIDVPVFAFAVLAFIINFIYYVVLTDSSFMKYSLFLLFSMIVVLLSRSVLYNGLALKYTSLALKAALITQLAVRFSGQGRYFFGRYSGTFNDPNQFGYYILMCVFSIYVISFLREEKQHHLWIILGGFLIIISQSSGMLLGYAIFFALYIWRVTGNQSTIIKCFTRFAVIFSLIVSIIMLFTIGDYLQLSMGNGKLDGLTRLMNRISSGHSISDILDFYLRDRSITRVVDNPLGLLYGTGEGMWIRYPSNNEIHATMISLCFYYGIIPYLFWIIWLKNNLENIHPSLFCVYVAHIAEAFTLANHRQPFFWILFVLASSTHAKRKLRNEDTLEKYPRSETI